MNKGFCSPRAEANYKTSKTCYTKNQLETIADNYNAVSIPKAKVDTNTSKAILLKNLKTKLTQTEDKWIHLDFMKATKTKLRNELIEQFRPTKPKAWYANNHMWLNTLDIANVMKQYESRYKTYKFFGVYPIDFSHKYDGVNCISKEICNFNLNRFLRSGYKQCGLILNLDKHFEPGSHWVSVYCGLHPSLPNFGCYYIDSNATHAPKEVLELVHMMHEQVKRHFSLKISAKFEIEQNTKRFQFKNTECGMFSMYFITEFLQRKKFRDIIKTNVDDDKVHKFRDIFYKPL